MRSFDYQTLTFFAKNFVAPNTLDRERLKAVLVATGLPADGLCVGDEVVEGAAALLYDSWVRYRAHKNRTAGPSKKLRRLHSAISEWFDECIGDYEWYLVHNTDREKTDAIVWFLFQIEDVINSLDRQRPKGKKEGCKTTFLTEICDLYTVIGGNPTISDGGPMHRFVTQCAALVDPTVVVPERGFRQLIQTALARKRRSKAQI
jgi:hypothetical protein